jgi:hypothetical protein
MDKWNDTEVIERLKDRLRAKMRLVGEYGVGQATMTLRGHGNIDTGQLVGSLYHKPVEDAQSVGVQIGATAVHGPWIEFGTGEFAESGSGRKGGWVYYYEGKKGEAGFRFTLGNKPMPFLRPIIHSKDAIERILR